MNRSRSVAKDEALGDATEDRDVARATGGTSNDWRQQLQTAQNQLNDILNGLDGGKSSTTSTGTESNSGGTTVTSPTTSGDPQAGAQAPGGQPQGAPPAGGPENPAPQPPPSRPGPRPTLDQFLPPEVKAMKALQDRGIYTAWPPFVQQQWSGTPKPFGIGKARTPCGITGSKRPPRCTWPSSKGGSQEGRPLRPLWQTRSSPRASAHSGKDG